MNINTSFINFKKKHKNKKNQIIFHQAACENNKIIENIINNFLIKKNCKIIIISHVGRPKGKVKEELSLKPICENLESKINKKNHERIFLRGCFTTSF